MAKLRFGYFIAPFHRAGTNPTLALQRDLEFVEHLDALGFDEVWYRRASLRRQRDHQLTRDLHRRGCPTREKNPLRHRRHLARVPQSAMGGRPADVARPPHSWPRHRRDGPGLAAHRLRDDRPDAHRHARAPGDQPRHRRPPVGGRDRDGQNRHAPTVRRPTATRAVLRRRNSACGGRRWPRRPVRGWPGKHGIGLLSIGATLVVEGFDALAYHWGIVEERAAAFGTTVDRRNWTLVGPMHIAETEEQARADVRFGIAAMVPVLPEGRGVPADDHAGRSGRRDDRHHQRGRAPA